MKSSADLIAKFEVFLKERMREFREPVQAAFAAFFEAATLGRDARIHVEVFTEGEGFDFHLFQYDSNGSELTSEPILLFNDRIEALWPMVQSEEMDSFWVWEDDPKWGRQVALHQPIDSVDLLQIVAPWFRSIVLEARGDRECNVTLALHDLTPAMPLC